jgi:hypothetical protein
LLFVVVVVVVVGGVTGLEATFCRAYLRDIRDLEFQSGEQEYEVASEA